MRTTPGIAATSFGPRPESTVGGVRLGLNGSRCGSRGSHRGSALQKVLDYLRDRGKLLQLRYVGGSVDDHRPGAGDTVSELFGVDGRCDSVLLAPNYQRGSLDSVQALLQTLIRDRPK